MIDARTAAGTPPDVGSTARPRPADQDGAAAAPATTPIRRSDLVVAVLLALLVIASGVVVGFRAHPDLPGGAAGAPDAAWGVTGSPFSLLGSILLQNLGAALLAYSGVFTLGISTVGSLFLTGAFVGATAHAASAAIGAAATLWRALPYVVLEIGGLLVVAGAGLLTLVVMVLSQLRGRGRPPFSAVVASSLRLLLLGGGMIVLGALVETLLIVTRR